MWQTVGSLIDRMPPVVRPVWQGLCVEHSDVFSDYALEVVTRALDLTDPSEFERSSFRLQQLSPIKSLVESASRDHMEGGD